VSRLNRRPPRAPASNKPHTIHRASAKGPVQKNIAFTNLKKVYWPAEKYTKAELIDYYRAVSKWLLPYLANRPVVLTRFPDGIDGKSFYQKDAPVFAPEWMRTVPIWSEETPTEIKYFVCDDEESLLYLATWARSAAHLGESRGIVELPDWCVIDLDPKEAPFSDVIRTAIVLHRVCESVGLPNYVKTTGKTGCTFSCRWAVSARTSSRECLVSCSRGACFESSTTLRRSPVTSRSGVTRSISITCRTDMGKHRRAVQRASTARCNGLDALTWEDVNDSLDPKRLRSERAREDRESWARILYCRCSSEPDLAQVLDQLASVLTS